MLEENEISWKHLTLLYRPTWYEPCFYHCFKLTTLKYKLCGTFVHLCDLSKLFPKPKEKSGHCLLEANMTKFSEDVPQKELNVSLFHTSILSPHPGPPFSAVSIKSSDPTRDVDIRGFYSLSKLISRSTVATTS